MSGNLNPAKRLFMRNNFVCSIVSGPGKAIESRALVEWRTEEFLDNVELVDVAVSWEERLAIHQFSHDAPRPVPSGQLDCRSVDVPDRP